MRLIGRERLASLSERNQKAAKWVAGWIGELRAAHWKRPADIRGQFPRALQRANGTFFFPVSQQHVGIDVLIDFSTSIVLISAIINIEDSNGN